MRARRVKRASRRVKKEGGNARRARIREEAELSLLARWEAQRVKLAAWRERVAAAPSMHGEPWKQGQLRHIDILIAAHEANKPQKV